MVTRDQALEALRRATWRKVQAAGVEWQVRGLSAIERKLLIERARQSNPMQAWEVCALGIIGENGEQLFTEADVELLGTFDGQAQEDLARVILDASGLLPQSEEKRTGE